MAPGLGGNSPPANQSEAFAPRTKSIVPPFANTSSKVNQFFVQSFPLTFKLWTWKAVLGLPPAVVMFRNLSEPRSTFMLNRGEWIKKVVCPVIGYKPIAFQSHQVSIAPASLLPGRPVVFVK